MLLWKLSCFSLCVSLREVMCLPFFPIYEIFYKMLPFYVRETISLKKLHGVSIKLQKIFV